VNINSLVDYVSNIASMNFIFEMLTLCQCGHGSWDLHCRFANIDMGQRGATFF